MKKLLNQAISSNVKSVGLMKVCLDRENTDGNFNL
ncbi:uncharacterized protein METZ01_LOCUS56635 [marine metagenome]|uniref:Uncharacterized protein n=1 Tax=marine metagenome TaxID=408172 RepID=A0A381SK97_9ZZZZ